MKEKQRGNVLGKRGNKGGGLRRLSDSMKLT